MLEVPNSSPNGSGNPPLQWVVVLPKTKQTPMLFANTHQKVTTNHKTLNIHMDHISITLNQSHGMFATLFLSQTQLSGHQLKARSSSPKICAEDSTLLTSKLVKPKVLESLVKLLYGQKPPEPKLGNTQLESEPKPMPIEPQFKPKWYNGELTISHNSSLISQTDLSLKSEMPKMMLLEYLLI